MVVTTGAGRFLLEGLDGPWRQPVVAASRVILEDYARKGPGDSRGGRHRPGDGNTVVVLVVIDNLVKGASGQAVQNMNLMFGLEETTGLDHVALMP